MATVFSQIVFDPEWHTYTLDGKRLTSVTKLIYGLKPPFKADYWAEKKAAERGVSKEVILKEWDDNKKASTEKGTKVHKYIEDTLLGRANGPTDDLLALNTKLPEMVAFDQFWSQGKEFLDPQQVEWVIGDQGLGIAGTTDVVFLNQRSGKLVLCDWKTGSKFNTANRFQRLAAPFEDLDDCEIYTYSLQSSLYRLIIERNSDSRLDDGYIVHLNSQGYCEIHKAVDYRERLLNWLYSLGHCA